MNYFSDIKSKQKALKELFSVAFQLVKYVFNFMSECNA